MDKSKKLRNKIKKAIVTQNNRFIYAKYGMDTNELKMFLWIVAQINSQKDSLFQVCEMPINEVFEIWQWKGNRIDYTYCTEVLRKMARKTYTEDFNLFDEKTKKEKRVFRAMPLFKFLGYREGQGYITYQLNDSLMKYFLEQKSNFTQIKFSQIQQMKSAYSIRIYNMLVCELKQNRQSLRIDLVVLQNLLEVEGTYLEFKHFNAKVLKQVEKDINGKSNIVLLDIKTIKKGRKVTELEFLFDYKNNDERIAQEKIKKEKYLKKLTSIVSTYIGKTIYDERYGELIVSHCEQEEEKLFMFAKLKESDKFVKYETKNFKDIECLEKYKNKAEELFYLNKGRVLRAKEAQNLFNLFNT